MPVHTRKRARACRREEENLDKSGPDSPLVNFISDYAGGEVFLANVIPRLNVSDLKFAYGTCKAFNETIRKSGFNAQKSVYRLHEFSSGSTLRYALERGLVTRCNRQVEFKYNDDRGWPWVVQKRTRRGERGRLFDDRIYTSDWAFKEVIASGREDLVRLMVEEMNYGTGVPLSRDYHISEAARLGYLDVLKYLVSKGFTVGVVSSCRAAEEGHLECLKYLRTRNASWVRQYSRYERDPVRYTPLYYAVKAGHLPIVTFCLENNCPKQNFPEEDSNCTLAVKNGDLECLQILRAYNVPWHVHTSYAAAEAGNLEILKYCVENGCPIDEEVYYRAAGGGHLQCLKYLNEIARVPWSSPSWLQELNFRGSLDEDVEKYVRDHWSLH